MASRQLALEGGAPVIQRSEHGTWPRVGPEEKQGVSEVLERGILSGAHAPEAQAFEAEFAEFVGAEHAMLTHSGTSALQVGLAAVGVGEGDEVIIPAYTFVATAIAVLQLGAVPIFCEVCPDTGNLDPSLLPSLLSEATRAIMPVHIHGCPADITPILAFARQHGLRVVEDAAQAHGATYQGKVVGSFDAGGGFSLQSSKNLSAGEGGVFVTNDSELWLRADSARNFGLDTLLSDRANYDSTCPLDGSRSMMSQGMGHMFRGNEMMAAFARAQLRRLPEVTAAAQVHAQWLNARLGELPGILPPVVPEGSSSVFHKYRVSFDLAVAGVEAEPRVFRTALMQALRAEGLESVLWQDDPIPAHPLFSKWRGYGAGWPFSKVPDQRRLRENYNPERYSVTRKMLDSSLLLFSQTRPLIAQDRRVVEAYAEGFTKVWESRGELVEAAARLA